MASDVSFFEENDFENSLKKLQTEVRQQEKLIENLQLQLDEQLHIVEETNRLEKEKLKKEKSLVGFLFEINFIKTFEDVFLLLRKELRQIHSLSEPIFILQWNSKTSQIFYFHSKQLNEKIFTALNLQFYHGNISTDMKKDLANLIGRPFGHLQYFKSRLRLIRKFLPDFDFYLLIENLSSHHADQEIREFIQDRIEAINLVLDRHLLEEQSHKLISRWVRTFDGFKDPICIRKSDGEILRSNASFQKEADLSRFERKIHVLSEANGNGIKAQLELYFDPKVFENLRKLEVLNEKMTALGRLAGNVAHELNNPLSGILSMSQILMQETPADFEMHSDLKEIEKATARCQKIIHNLVVFSLKKEDGDLGVTKPDEDIHVVISLLKSGLRNHHLTLELATQNYWIDLPSQLFQQVMFNVINNACQSMKETGHILISSAILVKDGKEICQMKVQDSGPGISLEIKDQIFEPFFSTKGNGEGTGLGLHLSKSIVEKFQGKIYFGDAGSESQSTGTVFYIEFPVAGCFL